MNASAKSQLLFLITIFLIGCQSKRESGLFQQRSPSDTGIDFVNTVKNTPDFNIFNYRNFYNGGGVAIGDINNDGLQDIYFSNNMGSNKLYLNKGNLTFEDITEQAGVQSAQKWSTGVVMVDINNDQLLDIYVCNAGYLEGDNQQNELYINQGDGTFKEQAADYLLDQNGYTTHAAFFDYDQDGDLDAYILNNSFIPVNTLNYSNKRELMAEDWPVKDFLKGGGDKLLKNENGQFIDATEKAGIYSSLIGFGLGVTVGDVNGDHLPDLYISNDFFERDYLYVNQGDGTFSEEIKEWMEHISLSSMGADMADINNDGYPEIFVTEMLPDDEYRLKTTTLFESYNIYDLKQKQDFYHQYMQNTLQYNNQNATFSEIAYYSGVAASDWSWGALMFDADQDGYRDIYVCNGIFQDVTNQDFIDFFANEVIQEMVLTGKKEEMDSIINKMPSNPIINKMFRNQQDLTFEEVSEKWGLDIPSFSNGAAYADLDNDGDQDLIVSNVNQQAFFFENKANERLDHHAITILLKGSPQNTLAVGAKVMAYHNKSIQTNYLVPSRGFQSSVGYPVIFGLGRDILVDSISVIWPDQKTTLLTNISADQTLTINYETEALPQKQQTIKTTTQALLREIPTEWKQHQENAYSDFYAEGLTFRLLSREGPPVAVGDINGDQLEDIIFGNGAGSPATVYIQRSSGFDLLEDTGLEREQDFEDTAATLFDADGDGDLDLFLGSGGNQHAPLTRMVQDRLYFNDGSGKFTLLPSALPNNGYNTSVGVPLDYDQDGDLDLFVGSRSIPRNYGVTPPSFLFENNGSGQFKDVSPTIGKAMQRSGLITSAVYADLTQDGAAELLLIGEWMAPQLFSFKNGRFEPVSSNLSDYPGWWNTVEVADLDKDGDLDLVMGNRGENFYVKADAEHPAKLWLSDFDENGSTEKIMTRSIQGKDMTVQLRDELTRQLPKLKKQNLKNVEFATKSIQDLFDETVLKKATVKSATYFKSVVALNGGNGQFTLIPLPAEVQFSCICDISCQDINQDQLPDLIMGGNEYGFLPQYSRLDASFGHLLVNTGNGNFEWVPNHESQFLVKGQVKAIQPITINQQKHVIFTLNDQQPRLFKLTEQSNIYE